MPRACLSCSSLSAPVGNTVCVVCGPNAAHPNWSPIEGADRGIPISVPKQERCPEDMVKAPSPKEAPSPHDVVQRPKHYQLLPGVEVIDVRRALLAKIDGMENQPSAFAVNCWDRALEYTIRAWEKNGVEDLEKAVRYLELCIGELTNPDLHKP